MIETYQLLPADEDYNLICTHWATCKCYSILFKFCTVHFFTSGNCL